MKKDMFQVFIRQEEQELLDAQLRSTALLRYICHEVRFPLHTISLALQNIKTDSATSARFKETLQTMRECANSMDDTLNAAQDVQQIQNGLSQVTSLKKD